MARHAVAARPTPQGKGKKAIAPVTSKRVQRTKAKRPVRASGRSPAARAATQHLDTIVRVGTAITFAPTGERLRVAKIEDGKITFEKLP